MFNMFNKKIVYQEKKTDYLEEFNCKIRNLPALKQTTGNPHLIYLCRFIIAKTCQGCTERIRVEN
jgi:hypothetical protein